MRKSFHIKAAKPAAQIALVPSVKLKAMKADQCPPFIRQQRGNALSYWHPTCVEVARPVGMTANNGERWMAVLYNQANRAVGVEYAGHFIQECRSSQYYVSLAVVVESMISRGRFGATERAFLDVIQELAMRGEQSLDLPEYIEQRRQQEIAKANSWLQSIQKQPQEIGGAA